MPLDFAIHPGHLARQTCNNVCMRAPPSLHQSNITHNLLHVYHLGHAVQVDATEFAFKQALARRDFDAVLRHIRSGKLCGTAIIAFLRTKGFPEVALHFVEDDRARFEIAIECGNLEVALKTAQRLDDTAVIQRLGVEAIRHGNLEIVEWCFQSTKAYERLSFLYTVTGNTEKLGKMGKIAAMRGNVMSRYQNALYSGSARARVQILKEAGHTSLAYVCAKTHGLDEEAEKLAQTLGEGKLPKVPEKAAAMVPPTPILRHSNWPLLEVTASMFEGRLARERAAGGVASAGGSVSTGAAADTAIDEADLAGGWGDDEDDIGAGAGDGAVAMGAGGDDGDEEGWDMEVCACLHACLLWSCVHLFAETQRTSSVLTGSCARLYAVHPCCCSVCWLTATCCRGVRFDVFWFCLTVVWWPRLCSMRAAGP